MAAVAVLTSEPNPKTTTTTKAITFPYYLNGGVHEECFELKIGEPFRTSRKLPHHHLHLDTNKAKDGEIDVFSADKYFNEALEQENPRNNNNGKKGTPSPISFHHPHHIKKDDHLPEPMKPRSRPRTPSIRSESSCDSRSHLLVQKIPRTHQQQPTNSMKHRGKSFLAAIGCTCACNGKNSVEISPGRVECGRSKNPPLKNHAEIKNPPNLYPQIGKHRKCLNLDTRMITMVSWNAIDKNPSVDDDCDTGSEGSSDLFEIESFPGNPNPFLPIPTSSYAPSEASIEWSVVTASAADFSVASDSEEPKMGSSTPNAREIMKPKRKPSILLGCRNQKAVGVAGDAYRTTTGGGRKHQSPEIFLPPTRFHAESRVAGFGVRNAESFSRSTSICNRQPRVLYI